MDKRATLKDRAKKVWMKYRGTDRRPTQKERNTLINAYWDGVLYNDPDYCVGQWVEDNFPGES